MQQIGSGCGVASEKNTHNVAREVDFKLSIHMTHFMPGAEVHKHS